jgi:hypothetical protein
MSEVYVCSSDQDLLDNCTGFRIRFASERLLAPDDCQAYLRFGRLRLC